MTLPLTTTTVNISRPPVKVDALEPVAVYTLVAASVPARVASSPASGSRGSGGEQEVSSARLYVDTSVDLRRQDLVDDEVTGVSWDVTGVIDRCGLGLDHRVASLVRSRGSA